MSGVGDQLRAGDEDRERVLVHLERAHGQGRIELEEFDERAALTWTAKTYGELAEVMADLPNRPMSSRERGDWRQRPGLRLVRGIIERAWILAVTVNLAVWALVSLATGSAVHPWWIWVAGPWGAVLFAARVTGVGRRAR